MGLVPKNLGHEPGLEYRKQDQRQRYQIVLQDLLMGTRLVDGSFQDTPIMGRVYGTAATLLSLHALGL